MKRTALALVLVLGPAAVACILNPQPLPPSDGAGGGGATASRPSGGTAVVGASVDAATHGPDVQMGANGNSGVDAAVVDASLPDGTLGGDAAVDARRPYEGGASPPDDETADTFDAGLDAKKDQWPNDSEADASNSVERTWDGKRPLGGD